MKNAVFKIVFLAAMGLTILGCEKTIADYPPSNLRAIAEFSIESFHNADAQIFVKHEGVIDEKKKTITVDVPWDADLSRIRPTITLSPWSTVSPKSLEVVDFTQGDSLDYVVTAQSGKTATYTVYITKNYIYKNADLYGVYFMNVVDYNNEPRKCVYTSSTSKIFVPDTQDLTKIVVHADLSYPSHRATVELDETGVGDAYHPFVDMAEIDCSSLKLLWRVTSEDTKTVNTFTTNIELFVEEAEL